jgi:hypothetical protein
MKLQKVAMESLKKNIELIKQGPMARKTSGMLQRGQR